MADKKDGSDNTGCFVFAVIVVLLFIALITVSSGDDKPYDGRIVSVQGTLLSAPQFRIYGNGQLRSVRLELKEYPNLVFMIEDDELERTRYEMMRTYLYRGDSVFLQVVAQDLIDSAENRGVSVYGLRSTTQIYLTD